jgi:hypothetical protein
MVLQHRLLLNKEKIDMAREKNNGVQALKLNVGEVVHFEDVVVKPVFTQYGESAIVAFAKDGTVFRKCFAQGGMIEFLNKNPRTKSIVLKKKIMDGENSYNVWASDLE